MNFDILIKTSPVPVFHDDAGSVYHCSVFQLIENIRYKEDDKTQPKLISFSKIYKKRLFFLPHGKNGKDYLPSFS